MHDAGSYSQDVADRSEASDGAALPLLPTLTYFLLFVPGSCRWLRMPGHMMQKTGDVYALSRLRCIVLTATRTLSIVRLGLRCNGMDAKPQNSQASSSPAELSSRYCRLDFNSQQRSTCTCSPQPPLQAALNTAQIAGIHAQRKERLGNAETASGMSTCHHYHESLHCTAIYPYHHKQ